jgi:ketosteroid isomerase-like protein
VLALSSSASAHAPSKPSTLEARLVPMLVATAANWNKGDLEGFIAPYGDSATYMTVDGPVHRADMRRHYETKYFAPGVQRQTLHYEQLSVRPLGDHYALMTGRYVLDGGAAPPRTGWFTLVWGETPDGWRILHDHSS